MQGGCALSLVIVMAALAIMLVAGGVLYRSPCPCFPLNGRFGTLRHNFIIFLKFKSWRGDIPRAAVWNRKCGKSRLHEI